MGNRRNAGGTQMLTVTGASTRRSQSVQHGGLQWPIAVPGKRSDAELEAYGRANGTAAGTQEITPTSGIWTVRIGPCGSDCAGARVERALPADHCRNGVRADDDVGGADRAIRACNDRRRQCRGDRHADDHPRGRGRDAQLTERASRA